MMRHLRIFECDRCGFTVELDDATRQPAFWAGVVKYSPPLANPSEVGRRWILCADCTKLFDDFMSWKLNEPVYDHQFPIGPQP